MEYHIVINGQASGPYTLEQLAQLGVTGETMVWYNGLPNWVAASTVPEIMEVITPPAPPVPPVPPTVQTPPVVPPVQTVHAVKQEQTVKVQPGFTSPVNDGRPQNYLAMAIIGLALFFPVGIPAFVRSLKVNRMWDEGKHDEAVALSASVRTLSLVAIIVGGVFMTFCMMMAAAA